MRMATIFIATVLGASMLSAQSMTAELKMQWDGIKGNVLKAAERMPDADYKFKPAGEPRDFAELVTHVADAHMGMCGAASGEMKKVDAASKMTKADIVAALKESIAFCDAAYAGLNDGNASSTVKMMGRDMSKFGALNFNVIHDNEVYGSMAVYYRLKNMVPPSTADRPARGGMKKE
jgi:hypothetical protein